MMNRCARRLLAVDVPSGLDADTGASWGPVVRPTLTLALGPPKPGLAEAGASMSRVLLADMRLPHDALIDTGAGPLDPFNGAAIVRLRPQVEARGHHHREASGRRESEARVRRNEAAMV